MKFIKWEIIMGAFLVVLTAVLTFLHSLIFKDTQTLLFYIGEDIVFLPLQVLLVTLVLQGWLSMREKRVMMEKLNMVIEVFFSEVGTTLLKHLFEFDRRADGFPANYAKLSEWSGRDFHKFQRELKNFELEINCETGDLETLRNFLMGKRNFLLRLLENPNLLEHESFTDLLMAVFHLTEELAYRQNCSELCQADQKHFAGDIKRAYQLLLYEWLGYMKHLKQNYPYLFSLAARTNPFDPEASVEVRE